MRTSRAAAPVRALSLALVLALLPALIGCPEPAPPIVALEPKIDYLPAEPIELADLSQAEIDDALYAAAIQQTASGSLGQLEELSLTNAPAIDFRAVPPAVYGPPDPRPSSAPVATPEATPTSAEDPVPEAR